MTRTSLLVFGALWATLSGACASSGSSAARGDSTRIVAAEMEGQTFRNAYEMIRTLRPHWLDARGNVSLSRPGSSQPVVYLDGMEFRDPTVLRDVLAIDVLEVEYINASEATSRYGSDHTGGAILVTTRR